MSIELPKDTEGREIPLDTKVLYNEDGKSFDVNRFTYSVVQTMPGLKWGVVFMNCRYDYCSSFYLTPPEPPDSWEKLEEDLGRVASCGENSTPTCAYTRQLCALCKFHSSENCTSAMCADIAPRIRRLRGED